MLACDHFVASWFRLTGASEVIRSKVIGGLVGKVVNEPAVAKGAIGYVGDVELAGGIDEAVRLVQGLEG